MATDNELFEAGIKALCELFNINKIQIAEKILDDFLNTDEVPIKDTNDNYRISNGHFHCPNDMTPSVDNEDYTKFHKMGKNHRLNGSAIIDKIDERYNKYYLCGMLHNSNGPAFKDNYCLFGVELSKEEYIKKIKG